MIENWEADRKTELCSYLKLDVAVTLPDKFCNGMDWKYLLPKMDNGVLYSPAGLSSSADAYLKWETTQLIVFGIQLKKQKTDVKFLIEEFLKAKPFRVDTKFTFLMISLELDVAFPLSQDNVEMQKGHMCRIVENCTDGCTV